MVLNWIQILFDMIRQLSYFDILTVLFSITNALGLVYSAAYIYKPMSKMARSIVRKVILVVFFLFSVARIIILAVKIDQINFNQYVGDEFDIDKYKPILITIVVLYSAFPLLHSF